VLACCTSSAANNDSSSGRDGKREYSQSCGGLLYGLRKCIYMYTFICCCCFFYIHTLARILQLLVILCRIRSNDFVFYLDLYGCVVCAWPGLCAWHINQCCMSVYIIFAHKNHSYLLIYYIYVRSYTAQSTEHTQLSGGFSWRFTRMLVQS
jgi:hypothetical protein